MDKRSLLLYWLCSAKPIAPGKAIKIAETGSDLEELFFEQIHYDKYKIGPAAREALARRASKDMLEAELAGLEKRGIGAVTWLDEAYPEALRQIANPPAMLYFRGNLRLPGDRDFAIVGARSCTRRGFENTFRIAADLAEQGVNVVSGMARGIDSAAHKGALSRGGRTTAVLGCGIDVIYPPENRRLYEEICAEGLVLSEYPMGHPAYPGNFPQRNRIICGLAQGLLLAEGRQKGGGSISVNLALEQGKEIFALPGDIASPESALPNTLIDEGANVALGAGSILSAMGWEARRSSRKEAEKPAGLDFFAGEMYNSLLKGEKTVDRLIAETGQTPAQAAASLTTLEIRGLIARLPGNAFTVKKN